MISARLDGELNDARLQALGRHLATCEDCSAFAADVAQLGERLDPFTAPEPRWGFTDRLTARLPSRQPVSGFARTWLDLLRPAPVGLGAAAFSFGVILTVLVSGESRSNGVIAQQDIEVLAGDYFDTLSEISVDQQLLALLPETEE